MEAAQITAITVTDYATALSRAVRAVGGAVVEGEVQRPKATGSGMLCFDLTDGDSKLACKVFRSQVRGLEHQPRHGDLVQARVERPDFWTVAGKLDLIVTDIRLAGEGEPLPAAPELLARLRAEGLCDPSRHGRCRVPARRRRDRGRSSDG
jgi:exonuclease VII large subunit